MNDFTFKGGQDFLTYGETCAVAREFGIVCLSRGEDRCEEMIEMDVYLHSLASYITVLHTPDETKAVSSTAVRRRVTEIQRLKEEIKVLVPEEILPLL